MSWDEIPPKPVTPSKPRHRLFVSESASALFHEQIRHVYEASFYTRFIDNFENASKSSVFLVHVDF